MTLSRKPAEALSELRWVERLVEVKYPGEFVTTIKAQVHRILQQRWRVPRDPTPESLSATALEWRDVPVVEEERGA